MWFIIFTKGSNFMANLNKEMIIKLHKSIGNHFKLTNHPDESQFPLSECRIGAVLDTETTDIQLPEVDVTEIAVRKFLFHEPTKTIIKPLEMFNQMNEPKNMEWLTPEIQEITSITPEMVKGKKIDKKALEEFMSDVSIIIAHNAQFDKDKVENVLGLKLSISWHCSSRQVKWRDNHGTPANGMEVLALFFGFDYDAHRAVVDVDATLHLLIVSNTLSEILDNAGMVSIQIRGWLDAHGSTHVKDTIKNDNETGYKFRFDPKNQSDKFWYCEVPAKDVSKVISFVENTINLHNPKNANKIDIKTVNLL